MAANPDAIGAARPLLTVDDVASELRVSPRHVAALVARGAIASIRIGRCRRIARAELERVLREGVAAEART
jgi:excisionase family DNA binding protein